MTGRFVVVGIPLAIRILFVDLSHHVRKVVGCFGSLFRFGGLLETGFVAKEHIVRKVGRFFGSGHEFGVDHRGDHAVGILIVKEDTVERKPFVGHGSYGYDALFDPTTGMLAGRTEWC